MSQNQLRQQYPNAWRLEIHPDRMILQKDSTGQLFGQRPEKTYSQLPRLLIADYNIASECVKRLRKQARASKLFGKPAVIVQWMAASDGGLSLVELRLLQELLYQFEIVGVIDGKGDLLHSFAQIETEHRSDGTVGKIILFAVIVLIILGSFLAYLLLRPNLALPI